MSVEKIEDVGFGDELGPYHPDTAIETTSAFARAVGWGGGKRFTDHEAARAEGHPGAMVPGIMGMGFLTTLIRQWAPSARIKTVDTVFRAPMLADQPLSVTAVVTDIDEESQLVELDLQVKNEADETRLIGTALVSFA